MRITITDEDIRFGIENAAAEAEEDNQVQFPDAAARKEFIDDCVADIAIKMDIYENDPVPYFPDYNAAVLDMARLYDYLL